MPSAAGDHRAGAPGGTVSRVRRLVARSGKAHVNPSGRSSGARRDHGLRPASGSTLAHSLEARGHSVAVIDQNADAFRRLGPDFAGITVTGVGFDRDVLRQAGIERADAFAAVSSGDNSNIISARLARETFGVSRVVARIYDQRRAEVYERLGIPTVATVRWTADRMLRHLVPEGNVEVFRDPTSTVSIVEVPRAPGLDRPAAATSLEEATGARVAYLMRFGIGTLPTASTVLQDGDQVFMLVTDDIAGAVDRRSPRRRREGRALTMRVAIAGAGNVGRSIAQELIGNGHQVMLIERQPADAAPGAGAGRRVDARRRVRAGQPGGGRRGQLRRGGRRDRRRQGQPGGVAAGQDRVRGAAGGRPGQPGRERVAVHRAVGRRRRGQQAAPDGRAGRGGGDASATWSG